MSSPIDHVNWSRYGTSKITDCLTVSDINKSLENESKQLGFVEIISALHTISNVAGKEIPIINENDYDIVESIVVKKKSKVYRGVLKLNGVYTNVTIECSFYPSLESISKSISKECQSRYILVHPNILPLLGVGMINSKINSYDHDQLVLFSPLMPYGSLAAYRKRIIDLGLSLSEKISFKLALKWCMQAASALEYLHTHSVVHGDIKQSSFMLDKNLNLQLTDFGFNNHMQDYAMNASMHSENIANPSESAYSANELFQLKNKSRSSDVYSLAIVMWELFSNKFVYDDFKDNQNNALDPKARNDRIRAEVKAGKRPDLKLVPEKVREIIDAMWHPIRERRPSCTQVLEALKNAQ
jgi:serine/threonine protein kinase